MSDDELIIALEQCDTSIRRVMAMTHNEAKQIIAKSDAVIKLNEEDGIAKIEGEVSIEELQAMLQLLEYNS